jgi:hypothetical protein
MDKNRLAFRVVTAIKMLRDVSEEEVSFIMAEVLASADDTVEGWEQIIEISEEMVKEESLGSESDDVKLGEKLNSLKMRRVASVEHARKEPKGGTFVATIPDSSSGVRDNLDTGDSILKQVEQLFDDKEVKPIPRSG